MLRSYLGVNKTVTINNLAKEFI